MSELERWGIHVDGIALSGFASEKEAKEYKRKCLQGKDAIIFSYQQHQEVEAKKSTQEKEDCYTPVHA